MIKTIGILIITTMIFLVNLQAAEQGNLVYGGKSIKSSGNLNITLRVANAIQISQLNDINLGSFRSGLDTDKEGNDNFCVFSNSESFSLLVQGKNLEGFRLNASSNNNLKIPYEVQIATISMTGIKGAYRNVNSNSTLSRITEVRKNLNCESISSGNLGFRPNLDIKIKIKEADMLDAIPANYKDIITIIASPE